MSDIHHHIYRSTLGKPGVVDTGEVIDGEAQALRRQRELHAMSSVGNCFYLFPCKGEICRPKGGRCAHCNGAHPTWTCGMHPNL